MRAVSVSRSNRDARTKEEPALNLWLREIPASGIALSSPSLEAYADGFVLAVSDLRWCAAQYLADRDPADPRTRGRGHAVRWSFG
jgi:hypothetical protein